MSSRYQVTGDRLLVFCQGDITKIAVDAMVNAANSSLAGGGGVDGAIHQAGGPEIMNELDAIRGSIGRCKAGDAVVTGGGRLPAKYVFHTVGPRFRDGQHGEPDALRSCYQTCLRLARERIVETISFPSISTGVYGYPIENAAEIAVGTAVLALRENAGSVREVKLVQFSEADHRVYLETARRLLGQRSAAR